MACEHNNANILCLGERVVGEGLALALLDAWMNAEFGGGRHARRVGKIDALD
jgi:ribose 5-phosphate isomerase B